MFSLFLEDAVEILLSILTVSTPGMDFSVLSMSCLILFSEAESYALGSKVIFIEFAQTAMWLIELGIPLSAFL